MSAIADDDKDSYWPMPLPADMGVLSTLQRSRRRKTGNVVLQGCNGGLMCYYTFMDTALPQSRLCIFSCPGSSIPDFGESVGDRHFRI